MCRYTYAYFLEIEDGEAFFRFPRLREIISSVPEKDFRSMSWQSRGAFAHDAVITALRSIISTRDEIPTEDDPGIVRADGFVHLSVREAMKLELYKLYRANCGSVPQFAKMLSKSETAARRLIDLSHRSRPKEIEDAIGVFGKRLVHHWSLEAA